MKQQTPEKRSLKGVAGRTIWFGALLIAAVVTVCVQIDFATRKRPELASLVPEWFGGYAHLRWTDEAIGTGDPGAAVATASDLVQARPLPAESLSRFAIAAGMAGDIQLSSDALALSASRGWRDPVAQSAVLYAALEAGDWTSAAQRLDALQRTGNTESIDDTVFRRLIQEPAGREALAARLVSDPNWMSRFIASGSRELDSYQFAEVVSLVHSGGGRPNCGTLASAARRLLRNAALSDVDKIWAGPCRRNSFTDGNNLDFYPDYESGVPGPFDWRYPDQAGLSRTFRQADGRWGIDYRNRDLLQHTLANRYLRFSPGEYSLQIRLDDQQSHSGEISARIGCVSDGGDALLLSRPMTTESVMLRIPKGCVVQQLQLIVAQGSGKGVAVEISDISQPHGGDGA